MREPNAGMRRTGQRGAGASASIRRSIATRSRCGARFSTAASRPWSRVRRGAYRRAVNRFRSLAPLLVVVVVTTFVPPVPSVAASLAYAAGSASATAPLATSTPSTDVVGDDENDLYRGTGGLIVSERDWLGDPSGRREVAGCPDCDWRVTRLCTKDQLAAGGCRQLRLGCPVGFIPVRVWLRHGTGDWAVVGEACQGPTPPSTVADLGRQVRDEAIAALPPLRAAVQPSGGALVGLPAVFRTGQPAHGIRGADLSVLGLDVRLDARVRWRWTYGDGTAAWASLPGGVWPDDSVRHTYRTAGTRAAGVTAVWRGEYRVEGLGPFVVPGAPLTQRQVVPVTVREARAVLVG